MICMIFFGLNIQCCSEPQGKFYEDVSLYDNISRPIDLSKYSKFKYDDLESLLCKDKLEKFYEPSYEELVEYETFLNNVNFPKNHENHHNYAHRIGKDTDLLNQEILSDLKFANYIKLFYNEIDRYIKHYIAKTNSVTYITRLKRIRETINFVFEQKYTINNETMFTEDIQVDYLHILYTLHSKYKLFDKLSNEIYNQFSDDLDIAIDEFLIFKSVYSNEFIEQRSFLLVKEYMAMYRYIEDLPEILTLGYVLIKKPSDKVIIIFRLLNLFINENEEHIKKYRTFIIYFIIKSFSYSYKNKINLIGFLTKQENTQTKHQNLKFFNWELVNIQREIIKKKSRLKNREIQCLNKKDLIHYNIILSLFIFQHVIFLAYHKAEYKYFEVLKTFYEKIVETNGCYGCKFYEFMNLVKKDFRMFTA